MIIATPLLSILTAVISGSARLHEKLGNAEAVRAVDRCAKRIERSVSAFGGRIAQTGEGEVMAVFESVEAALHAAIEMQQRVTDLPPISGVQMAIRVGISQGELAQAGEAFPENTAKEAALLAGAARPGQILASARMRAAIPTTLSHLINERQSAAMAEFGINEPILEITIPESEQPTPYAIESEPPKPASPLTPGTPGGCLRLRYDGDVVLLNERKTTIRMGRDTTCDLIIRDRRASRNHATIERRGSQVFLIDKSTNGTYVVMEGMPEHFLKHSECVLRGKGVIAFASSSTTPDADCAEFEFV